MHPSKQLFPIIARCEGKITSFKFIQELNTFCGRQQTLSGILILSSEEQCEKTESPISSNVLTGKVNCFKL